MTALSSGETAALTRLLRGQLTAVNQQFTHILALRQWGKEETAKQVVQVDNADFATSMRILDRLIEEGHPLDLESESFTPGSDPPGILDAEREMEARMVPLLGLAGQAGPAAADLIAPALSPRPAYAAWLAGQQREQGEAPSDDPERFPELGGLFAHLMTMIEQSMAHAFLHWHGGSRGEADNAWAAGGEAMMRATAFTRFGAARGGVPAPTNPPPLAIAARPEESFAADGELAARCAETARQAESACRDEKMARLCGKTAGYAEDLARWRPGSAHPATGGNPAFSSFARTYGKFVRPNEET